MERKPIEIPGFTGLYEVTEDGRVFSVRKQRYLKPNLGNLYDYVFYYLTPSKDGLEAGIRPRSFSAHRLVAFAFIGPPPTRYHKDCHHKDHDRRNNHWSNLEWVTHSENILRSYQETDRESPWKGVKKGPHSPETIEKMSMAKERACWAERGGERAEYRSVQALVDALGIYRKAFNRSIRSGYRYKGYKFGFVE